MWKLSKKLRSRKELERYSEVYCRHDTREAIVIFKYPNTIMS
jgi:hypothetical protein